FSDHFSQARLFWASMTEVERVHIIEAFTFELGKCYEEFIRERMVANLARVAPELCANVAAGLGLPTPTASTTDEMEIAPSPALSVVIVGPGPIAGRTVGVIVGPSSDLGGVSQLRDALDKHGARLHVVGATGGTVSKR